MRRTLLRLSVKRVTATPATFCIQTPLHSKLPVPTNSKRPYATMSDADYEAFLNKANQDVSGDSKRQSATSTRGTKIKTVNTEIPESLLEVDQVYVSDSDESFEPVSLEYDGKSLPSTDELGRLVGNTVVELSQSDFDPQGDYAAVIEAVKKVGEGLKFYRAELDSTRTIYLVLSFDSKHKRIVGLKALSIES